jgi:small subunit ribosomal protein S11
MNDKIKKVKRKINTAIGFACIHATFNNTIISITDHTGNVLTWASAGSSGFKGSRKKTPFAAQIAAQNAGLKAFKLGVRKVGITINGPGNGREIAIKGIQSSGLDIISIEDKTGVPHNGCRAPKRRRV